MHRRRTTGAIASGSNITIESGSVDDKNNAVVAGKSRPIRKKRKRTKGKNYFSSFESKQSILAIYFVTWLILFARSYKDGITAAGNETWYPVPLIGYVRSELALVCFLIGSVPFLLVVLGWTYLGLFLLLGVATEIPQLLMPGPIPMPHEAYHCFGIIWLVLAMVVAPFWKKPGAVAVLFVAVSVIMPNLPEAIKPLFSSVPIEHLPEIVINLEPDIVEDVGAAALETGPLLDFVWENRNDWVKVSHGRALGYFVFG